MFVKVDPAAYNVRWLSQKQKQLRQFLYFLLVENELPADSYIVNVGGADRSPKGETFIDLVMTAPVCDDNEGMCRVMLDKMRELLPR